MSDYILSCESTVDLSPAKIKELGLECINFHFYIDGNEFSDDLGNTVPYEQFYQAMREGADTKTAAIGTGEYIAFFRNFLEQGKDVLHVSLSSGISGTYESACIAADELTIEFPDRKVYIIDSLAASSGFGLLMQALSEHRASGTSIDELRLWADQHKLNDWHWFFSTDLTFYIKGGRVKPISGFVGNILGICPLLNMDSLGQLIPREKIRSKKKVIRRIVEKMEETADKGLDYDGPVFISHSDCLKDARAVADLVEERFPKMRGKVEIYDIGTTIGSHTGPGTVALFFWGVERGL